METKNGVQEMGIKPKKLNGRRLSIAGSVLFLLAIGICGYLNYYEANQNQNLGTYDDPEVAFRETQKALSVLSTHLKTGMENVRYLQEYDNSKNLIFKQQ
ncbi:hypothetical protein [Flavobacterium limnophilum]|uniref:hypothetical protein n=1 Tax=Flavobacterium limnophilum TaxID=3003262 RepID=UPI002482F968|nr:hypothetical protein [Flavobacterium limnophilum]